jgi:hypothetical protein
MHERNSLILVQSLEGAKIRAERKTRNEQRRKAWEDLRTQSKAAAKAIFQKAQEVRKPASVELKRQEPGQKPETPPRREPQRLTTVAKEKFEEKPVRTEEQPPVKIEVEKRAEFVTQSASRTSHVPDEIPDAERVREIQALREAREKRERDRDRGR